MYGISVFLQRLIIWRWPSVGGLPESPPCVQSSDKMGDLSLKRLPLISVHKWLGWTLTSHSFDTAFLCNQFEYFLCFVLFPPFAIFASKTHSPVMSPWLPKQTTLVGGVSSSNLYFYKMLQQTSDDHEDPLKETPLHSFYY